MNKLEAVNIMLASIGEGRVNSISGETADLPPDVGNAIEILDEITKDVMQSGWSFNTDLDYTFTRDSDNEITLPDSVLWIDPDPYQNGTMKPVQRGQRIYDTKAKSFTLAQNVRCSRVIHNLGWEDIPHPMQNYIAKRASRTYGARVGRSQEILQATALEEQAALREAKRLYSAQSKPNMLNSPGITGGSFGYRWFSPS